MKVDNISAQNRYKCINNSPTFGAIHSIKYCLKAADGNFYYVSDNSVIRQLQRRLVIWLNSHHNNFNRMLKGEQSKPKNMRAGDRLMRERLVNFFINNDADYKAKRVVRSAYIDTTNDTVNSYLVTGKHAQKIDDASKDIENVHRGINDRRDMSAEYLGVANRDDVPLSEADKYSILQAKKGYHKQQEAIVKELMSNSNIDKSFITFYFDSAPKKGKQKGLNFQLVNALIQKYMIYVK